MAVASGSATTQPAAARPSALPFDRGRPTALEDLDALLAAARAAPSATPDWSLKPVLFWRESETPWGCLSQWYALSDGHFRWHGLVCFCAEQAMMAAKARFFGDGRAEQEILAETHSASAVKSLGRAVRGFDTDLWKTVAFDIVVSVNLAKFSQNPQLLGVLLATGRRPLAEASPTDCVWGIGLAAGHGDALFPSRWRGTNLLGQALMTVREHLAALPATGRPPPPPAPPPPPGRDSALEGALAAVPAGAAAERPPSPQGSIASGGCAGRSVPSHRSGPRLARAPLESAGRALVPALCRPVPSHRSGPRPARAPLESAGRALVPALRRTVPSHRSGPRLARAPLESAGRALLPALRRPADAHRSGPRLARVPLESAGCVLVVVVSSADAPPRVALRGSRLPAEPVAVGRRDETIAWARRLLPDVVVVANDLEAVLAAEFTNGELSPFRLAWVVAVPSAAPLLAQGDTTWACAADVGAVDALAVAVALAKLGALAPGRGLAPDMRQFDCGGAGESVLLPAPDPQTEDSAAFEAVASAALATQDDLRRALREMEDEPGDDGYFARLSERVGAGPGVAEVPAHTRNDRRRGLDVAIRQPFVETFHPPTTTYAGSPRAQPAPPAGFRPRGLPDLLTASGLRLLGAWCREHAEALERAWAGGDGTRIDFRKTLVLGQEYVVPEARGIVWDLRPDPDGFIHPLDFTNSPVSHLNLPYLIAELEGVGWPDAELIGFLRDGAQFKADVGLDCVLMPHLLSLAHGLRRVDDGLRKLCDKGYYLVAEALPFFPIRCAPSGSVERKHEPGRPRRIEDQGQPRRPLQSTAPGPAPNKQRRLNQPVVPLNVAIDIHGSVEDSAKWPKEEKPTAHQLARNAMILRSAAALSGTFVLSFTDDSSDFFNQIALAPCEWWKTAAFWRSWSPDAKWMFLIALSVGFGISAASNIAQRFSGSIRFLILREMDRLEQQSVAEVGLTQGEQRWRARRQSLGFSGVDLRLFDSAIFTDDPAFQAVGVPRTCRLVRAARRVVLRLRLRMAQPAKRFLGIGVPWLGLHNLLAFGVLAIPADKRLRAIKDIRRALDGELTRSEARSLLGLLAHLLPWANMDENTTRGLFVFGDLGPQDCVQLVHRARLSAWSQRLAACSGVCASSVFSPVEARPDARPSVFMFIDAAKAGTPTPGLGGFLHGYWFHVPIPPWLVEGDLALPINELEFATFELALKTFWPVAANVPAGLFSDSLASYFAARNASSRAPLMVFVWDRLRRCREFREWSTAGLWLAHTFGPGNPGADMASRGYFDKLAAFCAQIGVVSTRLDPPPEAVAALDALVAEHVALHAAAAHVSRHASSRRNAQPDNLCGDGPRVSLTSGVRAPSPERPPKRTRLVVPLCGPPTWIEGDESPPSSAQQPLPGAGGDAPSSGGRSAPPGEPSPAPQAPSPALAQSRRPPPRADSAASRRQDFGSVSVARGFFARGPGAATSSLELRPADGAWFAALQRAVHAATAEASPASTLKTNIQHWRPWTVFCGLMGTSPIRNDRRANSGADEAGFDREVTLLCSFFVWRYQNMMPRARSSPAPKPQSAMNSVIAVRRVHRDHYDIEMVSTRRLGRVLKGLLRAFVREHGADALLPARKEPMTRELLSALLALPFDDSDPAVLMFRAMLCVCFQAGFRKSEVAIPDDAVFGRERLCRSALRWYINGTFHPALTPELRRQLSRGDAAVLTPPPSKNDPFGVIFGGIPIYLPFDPSLPFSAARHLADLELRFPCSNRDATPLFTTDGRFAPFRHAQADSRLRALLVRALPAADVGKYSMHSFRIGLACALLEAGASRAQIHSLCRWAPNSPSDALYARPNPEACVSWISRAAAVAVTSVTSANLPRIDNDDVALVLSRLSDSALGG
ncbi:MAG: NADAR domain-containing protein [Bacteroidota bacterium]